MMPDTRPPTQLLLAPAGSGKTQVALRRLQEATLRRPFGRAWVLLPTARQTHAFRERLLRVDPTRHAFFNVGFFNFYSLYRHILDAAGQPHRCLEEASRLRLLRHVAIQRQAAGTLLVFGEIAHTPGFVRVLGNFIYELKSALVLPDTFGAQVQTDRDRDLADLYADYQAVLQRHDLVDREGEGWLALDMLRNRPALGTDLELFAADGFDQFTPLQARLLAVVAGRAAESVVTLTTVPGEETGTGRRFARALDRLVQTFEAESIPLDVLELEARPDDDRHPAIRHLATSLHRSPAAVRAPQGGVEMLEAPEPVAEVAAILRRVKRLLVDGVHPNNILIAVRDWSTYGQHFASLAQSYDLSYMLSIQNGEPLRDNPAIAALFDLLNLHSGDFRRRDLFDVLRSPYFRLPGLTETAADQLDRISRALLIGGGRAAWSDAIHAATALPLDVDDDSSPPLLSRDDAVALERSLLAFFGRVTPPESASLRGFVQWLELLIGPDSEPDPDEPQPMAQPDVWSTEMISQVRRPARLQGVVERDLLALDRLKVVLRALLASQDMLVSLGAGEVLSWQEFMAELTSAVAATTLSGSPGREGRVLVTSVTDARGLPHEYVFIPGMSEGLFPARVPEDPLYLDSERARLADNGIPLQAGAERADDEGLFYELVSQASRQLVLSRPYIRKGAPWPESHLWRAVLRLFVAGTLVERLPIAGVVAAADAASLAEAALAAADGLNAAPPTADVEILLSWLHSDAGRRDFWARIRHARNIEWRRMSGQFAHDRYSGRLSHDDVVASVAALLGPEKVWSASQLNEIGTCGFRYFAGRLLALETLREPEDGMSFLHIGSMNHDILEHTYKQILKLGYEITPEYAQDALEILRDVARDRLRDAPSVYGFRPSVLWEQEKEILLRRLEAFVRADFCDNPLRRFGDGPRSVTHVEARFEHETALTINLGPELGPLLVRGKIDRIDRIGGGAVVLDYKTGSTAIRRQELERGRNFQMMIYLLVAHELIDGDESFPDGVRGGAFWHIGPAGLVGTFDLDDEGDAAIAMGREHLARYLHRARAGDFAAEATLLDEQKCVRYCDYSTMCRVAIMRRGKP